jgi:SAM-dependent methyltransferase
MSDPVTEVHKTSYDPAYFAKLAKIEEKHFWFRGRNLIITSLAKQLTDPIEAGFRVLEVGCGTGNVLQALEATCSRGAVVGMDVFAEGLRFARSRTCCQLVQGDIHRPPFGPSFDLIGAFDVIEHLADDLGALRNLRTMLKPQGALLLTVPAHMSLWSYFDQASHHRRRYEPQDLSALLVTAGYAVEFLSEFMCSIYSLVWLRRRLAPFLYHSSAASGTIRAHELTAGELRIVPVLNEVLSAVIALEAKLIARRRKLPFGTSLIAVARKE